MVKVSVYGNKGGKEVLLDSGEYCVVPVKDDVLVIDHELWTVVHRRVDKEHVRLGCVIKSADSKVIDDEQSSVVP